MKKAILLLFLAVSAFAQPMPQGKWWRRPEIVRQLQLTQDQQQKLDGVFGAAANDLIDARAGVDKNQVELRAELERPQINKIKVQQIVSRLNEARGRLFAREMMLLVDMRGVLGQEQWRKLRMMERRRKR